ncbi:MAG: copper homeostasis protein CutC [Gemmatimonadota bacterium]|jgi:copper homeostasis protein
MIPILVEGCVTTLEEAAAVSEAGGHRLELCRDLRTGGLTPEADTVRAVRGETDLPVMAMVRPRPGHFRATPYEIGTMVGEVEDLVGLGVDGIVLGVLDEHGEVDRVALRELVLVARVPVTFHRAFDEIRNPLDALESLQDVGVTRVLTSGGAATAWEGRGVLRDLVSAAGDHLVILGGGGVRGEHVKCLVEETGLREVHARASAVPGILHALGLRAGEGR